MYSFGEKTYLKEHIPVIKNKENAIYDVCENSIGLHLMHMLPDWIQLYVVRNINKRETKNVIFPLTQWLYNVTLM